MEKAESVSRIKQMRAEGIEPTLPDISAPWLVNYLMEIGPVVPAGMGTALIGWNDILAWQSLTATDLRPWEARLLRRLSADYLNMTREAENPDCPAPYLTEAAIAESRSAVDRKIGNAFKALAMSQRKA